MKADLKVLSEKYTQISEFNDDSLRASVPGAGTSLETEHEADGDPVESNMESVLKLIDNNALRGLQIVTKHGNTPLPIHEIWASKEGILYISVDAQP